MPSSDAGRRRYHKLNESPARIKQSEENDQRLQDLLRSHFESKFSPLKLKPLEAPQLEDQHDDDGASASSDDSWAGLSDEVIPEFVDASLDRKGDTRVLWLDKQERRSFMSNKPPVDKTGNFTPAPSTGTDIVREAAMEAKNLKNDLALQRLLREASMLKGSRENAHGTMPSTTHPSEHSGSVLDLTGTDRHKALDLRLQDLGAKESMYKQKKMPFNHRLGIAGKRRAMEQERRRDARENGIILERATNQKTRATSKIRRERGVGGPGIGKMRGGTLVLSRSDVQSINGDKAHSKGKKRR